MLEVCYRKGCLWYSWKDAVWEYSLDSVFAEFESESYGDQLNTSFILKRLQDLPPTSRAILAWGSLLGNTFSFSLVQKLLGGIFDNVDDNLDPTAASNPEGATATSSHLTETAVEGLQAALQAYILIPMIDEDHFRYGFSRPSKNDAELTEHELFTRPLCPSISISSGVQRCSDDAFSHRTDLDEILEP